LGPGNSEEVLIQRILPEMVSCDCCHVIIEYFNQYLNCRRLFLVSRVY